MGGDSEKSKSDSLPDWIKLSATIVITSFTIFVWATQTFVARTEMALHMDMQNKDLSRIATAQEHYSDAERYTATNLGNINSRLTGIETKVQMVLDAKPKTRN